MIAKFGDGVRRAISPVSTWGRNSRWRQHLSLFSSSIRRTPTSAMTSGAVAATTAPVSHWRCWISPTKWPASTPTMPLSAIASRRRRWRSRDPPTTNSCICWKASPPAVSIICTSRWGHLCVRLSSIPAIRTPLIEKYPRDALDTPAQVPVMGVGGVVNAADAEQGPRSRYGPDRRGPRLHRLSGLGVTYRRRRRAGAVYRQHPA